MRAIAFAVAALAALGPGAVAAQQGGAAAPGDGAGPATPGPASAPGLIVVNSAAVVEASEAARALAGTEREIRERVSALNERVKAELEAEERELVRLREELPAEAFEERTREFDRRVRAERRRAQERGALLLRFVQDARAALASAVPRVLEGLRRETGAAMIVDAGAVLAVHPSLDRTEAAIAAYDRAMGEVRFDPPAALLSE